MIQKKWWTYLILGYLVLAIGWWTLLLFKKNEAEFAARKLSASDVTTVELIEEDYARQRAMILGESIFLGVSLLAGIWIIFRSHQKEVAAIKQQNNFLMAVTHELKSPIAAIDLTLQTIQNRDLPKDKRDILLQNGTNETIRLKKLVDNLLIVSNNDQNNTSKTSFSLSNLLFETIEEFTSNRSTTDIDFSNQIINEGPIHQNKELTKRAIKNIIDNALKYGQSQTPVKIKLTRRQDNFYTIQVCDRGIGIPESEIANVFKKFYRIGSEQTRESDGTGLGLYISKRIISNMGGDVSITPNNPNGCCLNLQIPINEP